MDIFKCLTNYSHKIDSFNRKHLVFFKFTIACSHFAVYVNYLSINNSIDLKIYWKLETRSRTAEASTISWAIDQSYFWIYICAKNWITWAPFMHFQSKTLFYLC